MNSVVLPLSVLPKSSWTRCRLRFSALAQAVHRKVGSPGPMYVATVPVPDDSKFEAASLEEYLIEELNPSVNGRRMADR